MADYDVIVIGSGAGGLSAVPPGIETPGYRMKPAKQA